MDEDEDIGDEVIEFTDENFDDDNYELLEVIDDLEEDTDGIPDQMNEEEVVDLAQFTFTSHKSSVFSSDISSDNEMAVTGGQDDRAFVWAIKSGEIIMECTGHKDSITESSFNHNSTLIATGDLGGMVQVWDVKDKKLIWCFEGGDDLEWLQWHNLVNVLICGYKSGDVYVWQMPSGNCKVLPSNGFRCTTGKLLSDGKRLAVAYENGQIKLWDIKTSSPIWQNNEFLEICITSLELNKANTLLAIAPSSSVIRMNDGKCLGTFLLNDEKEVETILFNDELNVLVTGSLTGQLCVWDLGRTAIRHEAKLSCGATIMKEGPNGKVFVGGEDGAIYVCDIRNGSLVNTLTGHRDSVLSLSVSNDGSFILSTSDDGTAKIFTVQP